MENAARRAARRREEWGDVDIAMLPSRPAATRERREQLLREWGEFALAEGWADPVLVLDNADLATDALVQYGSYLASSGRTWYDF